MMLCRDLLYGWLAGRKKKRSNHNQTSHIPEINNNSFAVWHCFETTLMNFKALVIVSQRGDVVFSHGATLIVGSSYCVLWIFWTFLQYIILKESKYISSVLLNVQTGQFLVLMRFINQNIEKHGLIPGYLSYWTHLNLRLVPLQRTLHLHWIPLNWKNRMKINNLRLIEYDSCFCDS